MTGVANPNWLTIVGLTYSAIGVAVLVAAMSLLQQHLAGSQASRARAGRAQGWLGGLGGALTIAGFFAQGVSQFASMPLNGFVAAALVALIALLAGFSLLDLDPVEQETATATASTAAHIAAAAAAAGPTLVAPVELPVKLVSSA